MRHLGIINEIEEIYFQRHKQYVAESDKAWDAMHRALSDGTLSWKGGTYPLNHVVLGGRRLYHGRDYILSLKTPEQVHDIAAALSTIDDPEFRRRYLAIDPRDYDGPHGEAGFGYTWHWLQNVRRLYDFAARERRHVLFTADQ